MRGLNPRVATGRFGATDHYTSDQLALSYQSKFDNRLLQNAAYCIATHLKIALFCKYCDVPPTNIALRTYWSDNWPMAGHRLQALKIKKYLAVPDYRAMVPGMSEIPGLKIFRG